MSHEAAAESDYEEEMRDLDDLFRESDDGSADMTGVEGQVAIWCACGRQLVIIALRWHNCHEHWSMFLC